MLPKKVRLSVQNGQLYWRNRTLMITGEEAQQIADEVLRLAQQPEVRCMLVDNLGQAGAWPEDAERVWLQLMADLAPHLERVATLCSHLNAAQLNILSREAGTFEQIRAFDSEELAQKFLDAQRTHAAP